MNDSKERKRGTCKRCGRSGWLTQIGLCERCVKEMVKLYETCNLTGKELWDIAFFVGALSRYEGDKQQLFSEFEQILGREKVDFFLRDK